MPEDTKQRPSNPAWEPNEAAIIPLAMAATGQEVVLVKIAGGRRLQHRLAEMGLGPGVRFRVQSSGRPGPFIISLKDSRLVLGRGMAQKVLVRAV